jgi:hypothetical protein
LIGKGLGGRGRFGGSEGFGVAPALRLDRSSDERIFILSSAQLS